MSFIRLLARRTIIPLIFAPSLAAAQGPAGELEADVARMARIGAAWSPAFSPDAKRLAFVTRLSGVPQVWTVPTEGGWPTLVTSLDDQVSSVAWSPSGDWLAFQVAPGGGMNEQIYLIRPNGTDMRRITDGGKDNNWLGLWRDDGNSLAFASSRRTPEAMDGYVYDVSTGEHRLVAEIRGIGALTDLSRDGRRAILYRMRSRGNDDLYLLDLDTHRDALLTPHEGPGNFDHGEFSPDGRTVYLASDKDRDLIAFARVRIGADGAPGQVEVVAARDDAELQEFAVSRDGTTAALLWNLGGRSELSLVDLATLKLSAGPRLPGDIASELKFSRDGRLLALTASGSAQPQDIWILDRASGSFRQVTFSPHAGVDVEALVRPELVHYDAHDGLPLSGWLYHPRGVSRAGPLVLSFHGGPEGQERPAFNSTYQALLSRGIAVFAPNVRGSSGFGKKFVNLDNGALRVNAVRDIEATVSYLVKAGVADPKRIGIMGGSYGGYMVMAGLTEYPDLFAAGADLFGVVNFETFFKNTEPWMAAISTVEYGDPRTQAELLRRLSPINKVDRVRTPTIVLHGANDTNVPVVEAEQVVESLKRRGVPVKLVLFPDEGHGFRKTANRVRTTVAVVQWFETYLKPPAHAGVVR
jgi:dipeptidyl aminopeptidase/acylaminoacyl peptidase